MCRENCQLGDIYIIRCIETRKVYIGQTIHWRKHNNEMRRKGWIIRVKEHFKNALGDSCKRTDHPKFYNAIRKYGIDGFIAKKLCTCNIDDLDNKEKWWIRIFDSVNNGYNITYGGQDRRPYDTEKLSESITKLWQNEKYRSKQQQIHTKQWKTEEYRDNYFKAIHSRKRDNELPYNIYVYKKYGVHIGFEVTIKRDKKKYRKLFCSTKLPMEDKLKMAVEWRDETLRSLE